MQTTLPATPTVNVHLLYIVLLNVLYTSLFSILHRVLHTLLYIEEEAGRVVFCQNSLTSTQYNV